MENKKEEDIKGKEGTTPTEEAGSKSKADEEVERLNADTDRINEAIAENENAKAREKVSGTVTASQPAKELTEEEQKKSKASEFFKDTALGDAIDKT